MRSTAAIIALLIWLYVSAYLLLLCAELNQVLDGKSPASERA